MECPMVLFLILATANCAAAAGSPKIYASENPVVVGSSVTLFSTDNVTTGAWMFNNDIIVMLFPGDQIITDTWRNRVTFNSTNSALTIKSLQLSDSGVYTLQALNSFRVQLTLSVQVAISNVTLKANETNLVEFNDTAVLMCSVLNGSSLSYVWLNGSSVVTPGREVQLSDGGATLTIVSVTRYDEGPFKCNVSNGVSQEISQPLHLNISYGPSNVTMMIVPLKSAYITGSNITLSCSAESRPQATIQWLFNGMFLDQSGTKVQLERATQSNSGNYQCIFYNPATSRFSSRSATIWIVEPISAVMVNHTGGPVILHESLILHCEVTGSVSSILWWRNGQLITADNTTVFDMNNKTLTIKPVQHSDQGDYMCQAFNAVSMLNSSSYTVNISYGPTKPVIEGMTMALTGTMVTLNCSTSSYPQSHISWYFNGSLLATTSVLSIGPLALNMSGKYICMAFNNVTGKNSSAYTMLTVLAPVTMVSIKVVSGQPIQNQNFTLTCETAGGVESITWMYGPSPLYANGTRILSMDNSTLTFDPVMMSDSGNYKCVASNPLSSVSSQMFTLEVIYGPLEPVIMGPHYAKTGYNVTFTCSASSNPPSSYKWFFNDSLVANSSMYVTPALTIDMSGMYTCMAYNNITGKNSSAYIMLTVLDAIDHVKIETAMSPAIEGHSYQLTCNVSGPVGHVYWMKDGDLLHEDSRIIFSMDNRTITFNPLNRNDTGYYQCVAINASWNTTSSPHKLLVNFGPDALTINGPAFAETGHRAVFHCVAKSEPPSQFSWWFNGSNVANTSMFTTQLLSLNMSGEYTCMAYNNVTGMNSTNSTMLTVIEAISSVMVRNSTVPINSENFTLICDVTGPYDTIYWMKDDMQLKMTQSNAEPHMSYRIDKNMLHFTPLMRLNDGAYQCVAVNRAGPHESPDYMLMVNYGPLSVTISRSVGIAVAMVCFADSRPDCEFTWFFNNQSTPLKTGSVITFLAIKENEGNYTCKARNPVTNITMYHTKAFTAAATLHFPSHGGLMLMGLFALSIPVMFN